jgi:hypothetical protein
MSMRPECILLFTDFGWHGPYVGQLHRVLVGAGCPVIDLMHDAPCFNPRAASYLLAALAETLPRGGLFLGVVDPGVGGGRRGLVLRTAGAGWWGRITVCWCLRPGGSGRSRPGASTGVRRGCRRAFMAVTCSPPSVYAWPGGRHPRHAHRSRLPGGLGLAGRGARDRLFRLLRQRLYRPLGGRCAGGVFPPPGGQPVALCSYLRGGGTGGGVLVSKLLWPGGDCGQSGERQGAPPIGGGRPGGCGGVPAVEGGHWWRGRIC